MFAQPSEVLAYVKVTDPDATPVTKPALLIVAIPLLLELHVPFEDGVTFVDVPTQPIEEPPRTGFPGIAFITTLFEDNEVHKLELVTTKVKVALGAKPVTV